MNKIIILFSFLFFFSCNNNSSSIAEIERTVKNYQNQLVDKKTNTPNFTIYVNNNGSNGMSEIGNPIDAHFDGIYGGCSFVDKFGTHIVYGTETDDEPWLNLRSKGSMKGEIIGRLDNGTEVNILDTKGKKFREQFF